MTSSIRQYLSLCRAKQADTLVREVLIPSSSPSDLTIPTVEVFATRKEILLYLAYCESFPSSIGILNKFLLWLNCVRTCSKYDFALVFVVFFPCIHYLTKTHSCPRNRQGTILFTQPKMNNLFWPDENSIEQCFAANVNVVNNTEQVVEPDLACNQVNNTEQYCSPLTMWAAKHCSMLFSSEQVVDFLRCTCQRTLNGRGVQS